MTEGDAKAKEDAKTEWARSWIAAGLAAVEAIISSTAGKCCFGDEVTLADICLVPQVPLPLQMAPFCNCRTVLHLLALGVQRRALRGRYGAAANCRQSERASGFASRVHRGASAAAGRRAPSVLKAN
jgi:glutathione S-transferase